MYTSMKIRFIYLFFTIFLFQSCSNELEEPTSLLTQVIKFYEDLEQAQMVAFATSAEGISDTSYVYFYPVEGATNFQYFQTSTAQNVSTNLANYNVRDLEIEDVFGGKLKRFVRTSRTDVYCIVTYQANGIFYRSLPVEIKDQRVGTNFTSFVTIDQSQPLMPNFIWSDQGQNSLYFQVISDANQNFLSGTFTTTNQFQYGSSDNVIANINSEDPPALIENDDYNFTLFSMEENFWVDLVIQATFTAN